MGGSYKKIPFVEGGMDILLNYTIQWNPGKQGKQILVGEIREFEKKNVVQNNIEGSRDRNSTV